MKHHRATDLRDADSTILYWNRQAGLSCTESNARIRAAAMIQRGKGNFPPPQEKESAAPIDLIGFRPPLEMALS